MSMVYIDIISFLFKQKTAYELRISDWSSDVCSSDLFLSFVQSSPVLSISLSERIVHGRSDARGYRKRPPQGRTGQGPVAGIGKIGRASCRERVCQYV